MNNKFDFKDINLIPELCVVNSRSECDTSVIFGKHNFNLPVIPANMECVINYDIAEKLARNNYFYIMHRFIKDTIGFVTLMNYKKLMTSISIGVNQSDCALLYSIRQRGLNIDYITIDIAHGHALTVKAMITYIKLLFPETFIIAGNVCTPEAVIDLESWGADSVKVGISGGSGCTTFQNTGFGNRGYQASMIQDCARVAQKPIIADGGIKQPGDITKALVMGATMVMTGGMMSGFKDSPGEIIFKDNNVKYKEFWGSASMYQSGKTNRIEGTKNLVLYKDKTILEELVFLQECLQSSISYGGGNDLSILNTVKWK